MPYGGSLNVEHAGEKHLIEKMIFGLYSNKKVCVGAGTDDAACVGHAGSQLVMTTDIMFRDTHFPAKMSLMEIGKKIAVANISDLAAMGAKPLALMVAFGIPPNMKEEEFRQIVLGINDACERHNCPYVGGDTKKAKELTLCGSAIGFVNDQQELLKRSNARPGDIVCLTGRVGDAACGMLTLVDGIRLPKNLSTKLLPAFTDPRARVDAAIKLTSMKARISAMDITDGVFYTCSEIARASGVGMEINSTQLPISNELKEFARLTGKPIPKILSYGEDYELVVTLPADKLAEARKKTKLYPIGKVVIKNGVWLDGERVRPKGYDAFKNSAK